MDNTRFLLFIPKISEYLGLIDDLQSLKGIDVFMPFMDKITGEGAIILFKIDGERIREKDTGIYTAVVSGRSLGETIFE